MLFPAHSFFLIAFGKLYIDVPRGRSVQVRFLDIEELQFIVLPGSCFPCGCQREQCLLRLERWHRNEDRVTLVSVDLLSDKS